MVIYFIFNLIAKPAIVTIPVFNLQRGFLIFGVTRIIFVAIAFLIANSVNADAGWAIALFPLAASVASFILTLCVFSEVRMD